MKFLCALLTCLCFSAVIAQDLSQIELDPETVNSVMQQAQQAQSCMQQIDQAEVQRVKAEADAVAEEIRGLCAADDRATAQSRAVAYGMQLEKEPVVLEAKQCLGIAALDIPQTTWAELDDAENAKVHVCDI